MQRTRFFLAVLLSVCLLAAAAAPSWAQSSNQVTLHSGATSAVDGVVLDTPYYSTVTVQVSGTFSGTVTFKVSEDGTTWDDLRCTNTASGAISATVTSPGFWQCPVGGAPKFKAPVTIYGSGAIVVKANGSIAVSRGSGGGLPNPGSEGDCLLTGSGAWAAGACPGAGTGAPTTPQYWTGAADATLSAEKNLGALSTALVINTAGVPSAYAGVTCSNQVLRILSAVGGGTCATITASFVDTTIWTGTASSGLLKASSQGVLAQATAGTDYVTPAGNVATATALAANPADCSANRYGTAIAANGDLTCGQVSLSAGVTSTLPLANGGTNQTTWTPSDCVRINSGGTSLESAGAPCGSGGGGSIVHTFQALTSNGSISGTHKFVTCDATGGAVAVTLPAASAVAGADFQIKKIDASANFCTVTRAGSDTIDGATTAVLHTRYETIGVASDGTSAWSIF